MAERVTIREEEELWTFEKMEKNKLRKMTIHFDACVLQHAVEEHPDLVEYVLENGNFRIARPAFNELLNWKKPSLTRIHKKEVWAKVQKVVQRIKKEWPQNIDNVSAGSTYEELTMLEPLLSKTITYELFSKNIEEICKVLTYERVKLDKFYDTLAIRVKGEFRSEWKKRLAALSSKFRIREKDLPSGFDKMLEKNGFVTLKRILEFVKRLVGKGYGSSKVRKELKEAFENKVNNDKLVLVNYLQAKKPKHLPTHDKDIYELAILHREMVPVS